MEEHALVASINGTINSIIPCKRDLKLIIPELENDKFQSKQKWNVRS